MNNVFVKPKKQGAIIRDPFTQEVLNGDGEYKPDTAFWRRRLAAGDVVKAKPVKKAVKAHSKEDK